MAEKDTDVTKEVTFNKIEFVGPPNPQMPNARMLMADPEGVIWSRRGILKHQYYDPSDPDQFYSKIIIEVLPKKNDEDWVNAADLKPIPKNPRVNVLSFNPPFRNALNTPLNINAMYNLNASGRYDCWRLVNFTWESSEADPYWDLRQGEMDPYYINFQLPTKTERYIYIDLSIPIRAIYLPLSFIADPGYEDFQSYIHLNFTALGGPLCISGTPETGDASYIDWSGDRKYGIESMYGIGSVMRIDTKYLYELLPIPRALRRQGEIGLNGIIVHGYGFINCNKPPIGGAIIVSQAIKHSQVLSDNIGLHYVIPKTPPSSWLKSLLKSVIEIAANFIPVVGPLVAIASDLAIDLIEDPGRFAKRFGSELGENVVQALASGAIDYKSRMKPLRTSARSAELSPVTTVQLFGIATGIVEHKKLSRDLTPEEIENAKNKPRSNEGSGEPKPKATTAPNEDGDK
jgi:hypothetical protein